MKQKTIATRHLRTNERMHLNQRKGCGCRKTEEF